MSRFKSFFLTLPGFYVISQSNIRLLYFVRVIRDILNKVTLFFLPIFLFNYGKDLAWFEALGLSDIQAGMISIAVYFSIQRLTIFFSAIPLGQVMIRKNFETSIIFSYLLRVISFAGLYFANQYPVLIIVAAIFEGIQSNLFWNSFFTLLTEHLEAKTMGRELGLHRFIFQILGVLTPAVSGYFAYKYGIEVLFLLGIVLSLTSAILVTGITIKLPQDDVSWKELSQWVKNPSFIRAAWSFCGKYINDMVLFLWPLYVFLVLGSVDRVGFLYTLSLFIALVVTFFVGGYIDKFSTNKKPFLFSGGALSLVWLVRTQALTVWGIALADTVEKLFANFHWLFYDVLFIKRGKGSQAFSYFVYREMGISIVAIIFWALVCVFFMIADSWSGVFIFAGIGVLLSLLIGDTFHEKTTPTTTGLKL